MMKIKELLEKYDNKLKKKCKKVFSDKSLKDYSDFKEHKKSYINAIELFYKGYDELYDDYYCYDYFHIKYFVDILDLYMIDIEEIKKEHIKLMKKIKKKAEENIKTYENKTIEAKRYIYEKKCFWKSGSERAISVNQKIKDIKNNDDLIPLGDIYKKYKYIEYVLGQASLELERLKK